MKWPWSNGGGRGLHRRDPEFEALAAEVAEERAAELEKRADLAEESLTEFLRRVRDPWAGPVLNTIHARGRHAR